MEKGKQNTLPFYNKKKHCYQVVIDGRTEEGDIEYVISEFIHGGLFYRFRIGDNTDHEHRFSDVLGSLLGNPDGFSISGFEEDYSRQEIQMISTAKARLLEHGDFKEG